MFTIITSLLFGVFIFHSAAEQPEKIDLFEADTGGYKLYRIPGIVVTSRGTILAYCEARKSNSDWGSIDIVLKRSTDGGKTWSEPQTIADVPGPKERNPVAIAQKLGNPKDVTYNNPVMIADRSGAVHLLFCLEYLRCFYSRSDDDGKSWRVPSEITASAFDPFKKEYDWKVLATGPCHGIQLKNGRLVVPVWLSLSTGGNAHRPSVVSTIYSDDSGKTWKRGAIAIPHTAEWVNPNESTVAELPDGSVLLNARSESKANRRLVTISADGATKWSKPAFDDALVEPVCMGSLLAIPGQKPRLLFSHPDNLEKAGAKTPPAAGSGRDRKNVTVYLSDDGGKTWSAKRSIESGFSAYSDLAMLPDGTVLLFYERAGANTPRYGRLTLARFSLDWITNK
jgi:sialidase-1